MQIDEISKAGVLSVCVLSGRKPLSAATKIEVDEVCQQITRELQDWQESLNAGGAPPEYRVLPLDHGGQDLGKTNLSLNFAHYAGFQLRPSEAGAQEVFSGPYHLEVGYEGTKFVINVLSEDRSRFMKLEGRLPRNLLEPYWIDVMGMQRGSSVTRLKMADEFRKAHHGALTDAIDRLFDQKLILGSVTVKNIALLSVMLYPDKNNPYSQDLGL